MAHFVPHGDSFRKNLSTIALYEHIKWPISPPNTLNMNIRKNQLSHGNTVHFYQMSWPLLALQTKLITKRCVGHSAEADNRNKRSIKHQPCQEHIIFKLN